MEKSRVIASRLVGKARKAMAAFRGETGVFSSLEEDHAEIRSLMHQLSKTSDTRSGVVVRRQLFEQLRRELLVHIRAEEVVFYGHLKQHDETRRRTLRSLQDHHEIEVAMREVDGVDPHDLRWLSAFQQLRERFEQHVGEEEQLLFPQAHRLLSRSEIHALDERLEVERERQRREVEAGRVKPAERTQPPAV